MSFEIRELTEETTDAFRQAISSGFGHDADLSDEAGRERFQKTFTRERMLPVFDGDKIVGTGGDFDFLMTVPGGAQVPMSGLTIITVQPTHTRRGILTAMMRKHIDAARERGEPLGGLWASEVPIYGRFGYGEAARLRSVKYDARQAGRGLDEDGVTVRLAEVEEAREIIPPLFEGEQARRPGMYRRSDDWWNYRLFFDPEKDRGGLSAQRYAIAEADGQPVGYMLYRQKSSWDQLPEGEIRIRETIASTDAGYRALWHYASNVDLFPHVKYWNLPLDDPLQLLLINGRTVQTENLSDGLWVRLIDVAEAMGQREYIGSGAITIQVADAFAEWNAGTYRLSVDDGVAKCERVTANADVAMDVNTLGALYLGGIDPIGLARVGRIEGQPDAVAKLSGMVRSPIAPWCPEIF